MSGNLRVNIPVLDVWSKPLSGAERISQLIYNEQVIPLAGRGPFLRVRCEDGYSGWARKDHLAEDSSQPHKWFVDVPVASLLDGSTGRFIGKLSFGTCISILEETESFGRIEFAGRSAWISLGCVSRIQPTKRGWRRIKSFMENLVGTPYLWGGRSGFGLDCSGLVQIVFNRCGYQLLRDSMDQRKSGRKVSIKNVKSGDLIFSPGHVAVYYGSGKVIHSSMKAGGVFIENLLPDLPDSRSDIYDKIELIKRVI